LMLVPCFISLMSPITIVDTLFLIAILIIFLLASGTLDARENPPVNDIVIIGNQFIADEEIMAVLSICAGEPYNEEIIIQDI